MSTLSHGADMRVTVRSSGAVPDGNGGHTMAIRIRVYPQYGRSGYGGYGGYGRSFGYGGYGGYGMNRFGGYGALANVRLQNEKRTSSLRLNYERALWQERIKTVQLQSQLQYGGAAYYPQISPFGGAYGNAMLGGLGLGATGFGGAGFFGSLGLGNLF